MPIVFSCKCGIRLKVRAERAGGQVVCRFCGKTNEVPLASEQPVKPTRRRLNVVEVIAIGAAVIMCGFIGYALLNTNRPAPAPPARRATSYKPEFRGERRDLIDRLRRDKLIKGIRIRPDNVVEVDVPPAFIEADMGELKSHAAAFWAWGHDEGVEVTGVEFVEPLTRKVLGSFSETSGLVWR